MSDISAKIRMSDNIPFEIQTEIIKRLPIRSLIQFRSVSKPWKSLIDSSKFIADYHRHTQRHHLLVSYTDLKDCQRKYVSVDDDNTFPRLRVALNVPMSVKLLNKPWIIGSSQGLFCFYSYHEKLSDSGTKKSVIWNPSIRKSVDIPVYDVLDWPYRTVIGFGVSPHTSDPKLVKIIYDRSPFETVNGIPWQVEVFSLSSGVWRTPSIKLASNSLVLLSQPQVDVDGCIYWLASSQNTVDTESQWYNLILSFDITSEEFTEVDLPDSLTHGSDHNLVTSKLRGSLIVLETNINVETAKLVYGVWMMEHDVPNLFTKLFTIIAPYASDVLGFRKSGEAIIESRKIEELCVYEPYSERVNRVGISGSRYSFSVSSYMESLLLLDH